MKMARKIRVLVVDDSAFMRKLITAMIESDPHCEVVKTAKDGIEALKAIEELRPDVVTLDIEMPEIDGLTCVAYIMEAFPTPVVVVTGFSEFLGEETIKALEYGAVGIVRKPGGPISRNIKTIRHELLSQIKLAMQVDVTKLTPVPIKETKEELKKPIPKTTDRVFAIASSSGGPRALSQIIPKLPADLPAGVVVAQHMPAEFVPSLAERLNWESALEVKVAEDLEPIKQGKVLIAPGGCNCTIESRGEEGKLIKLAPVRAKERLPLPSADKLMTSLAPIYGRNATGIVLTGMGNDGTEGLRAIKKHGGKTMAEDKSTCLVYGMPREAVRAGVVDKIVPLDEMADEIKRSCQRVKINHEDVRIPTAVLE
jgi:two-component system chemotaxis response regulator CheB